jgi:hypothetical protein
LKLLSNCHGFLKYAIIDIGKITTEQPFVIQYKFTIPVAIFFDE